MIDVGYFEKLFQKSGREIRNIIFKATICKILSREKVGKRERESERERERERERVIRYSRQVKGSCFSLI